VKTNGLRRKLMIGFGVFGALAVIKVIEYFVGTRVKTGGWPYLLVLAFAGAVSILYYFMHINDLGKTKDRDDG